MVELLKWINMGASVVTASGVYLVWVQVKLLRQQIQADHERTRRQNALDLLLEWTKHLKEQSPNAIALAETLDDRQSVKLYNRKPFELDKEHEGLLTAALKAHFPNLQLTTNNNCIQLKEEEAIIIRMQIINYLNMLESILAFWRHNMADRKILEEQFQTIFDEKNARFCIHRFRQAAGGQETFPAIFEFMRYIQKKKNIEIPGELPIV